MRERQALLAGLLLLSMVSIGSAYSQAQISSLLSGYSVPVSLSNYLKPVSLTYAGSEYVALYNGSSLDFLVNVTGSTYSIVLNSTSIAGIIRNYTLSSLLNSTNFTALGKLMQSYRSSSSSVLSDCYYRSGFTSGLSCNATNYCAACETVPICSKIFRNASINVAGPTLYGSGLGIFGAAIMNFGNQYVWLNNSFNNFYNATKNVDRSNAAAKISALNSAFLNVSNLSTTIGNSTLFLYTGPVDIVSTCSDYSDITAAPWYCAALGFCENPTFNSSQLALVNISLANIDALPTSSSQIAQLAGSISSFENAFVYPVASSQKLAQLKQMLNSTVPGYSALVNGAAVLLSHISDPTLRAELSALESTYSNATTNYFNANLTRLNRTIAAQYSALLANYTALNDTYSAAVSAAADNTARIIEAQLGGTVSAKLGDIALAQFAINDRLAAGELSNLTAVNASLSSIRSQLWQFTAYPVSLGEAVRAMDGGLVRSYGSLLGLDYPSAVRMAPVLGSAAALTTGIAVIAIVFLVHGYLARNRRLAMNPRTAGHWRTLYLLIGGLTVAYMVFTFFLLSSANASAPYGAFQSAYRASPTLVVAVNGTPTLNEYVCASRISAGAVAQSKRSIIATFSNGVCNTQNTTSTVSSCLGAFAKSNTPVVLLTNSTHSGISLYSLYGTILSVSGNDSVMNSCYAALLTR